MILIISENKLLEKYIVKPTNIKYYVFKEPVLNTKIKTILFYLSIIPKLYFVIKIYNIKVVITTIDNSQIFQQMSKIFKKQNFYAIQNGLRSKRELRRNFKNDVTNFFCFGECEKNTYREFGHKIQNCIPVGTYLSSIYLDTVGKTKKINHNKYKVCIVGQISDFYFNNKILSEDHELEKILFSELLDSLIKISKKNNFKMNLACRQNEESKEYKFFKKKCNSTLIDVFPKKNFSTYDLVMESDLVISMYSTVMIEAVKFNKKILFVDCSNDNRFAYFGKKFTYNNISIYNEKNLNNLEKRIVDLINMKQLDYKELVSDFENYINEPDKDYLPTYKKIREILIKDNFTFKN